MQWIHYDSILSGENKSDILAGSNGITECLSILNDRGRDYTILALVLRYENGLDACTMELFYNNDIKFISGDTQLTAVGNTKTASVPRDEFPVKIPFDKNSKVNMQINPKGLAIKKGDISLSLLVSDAKFEK